MRSPDEIIAQITTAFARVAYPGRDALLNAHCCECAEVSASYADKRWSEIGLADVLAGSETALLNPTAWRYYLPAVMICCVRAPDGTNLIQDNLATQLEPPDESHGVPAWFRERSGGFDAAQRAAIVTYLEWYRKRDDARWNGAPPRRLDGALSYWAAAGDDSQ